VKVPLKGPLALPDTLNVPLIVLPLAQQFDVAVVEENRSPDNFEVRLRAEGRVVVAEASELARSVRALQFASIKADAKTAIRV
jgi:hypothetical protein